MATAVFFHAHPDDETLFTGGTMAKAAAEGHRVVLVTATRGDQGEDRAGLVAEGETLAERREEELRAAVGRLGVDRCVILGYGDSGIDGAAAGAFSRLPAKEVEEVAARLAAILREEQPDVFVTYDERGIYGHPDHIQVHKVGLRAAQLAEPPSVFLATVDRERLESLFDMARGFGISLDDQTLDWAVSAGVATERITTQVDVSAYIEVKRDALAEHRTQFPPGTVLFQVPVSVFGTIFGMEWFIRLGGSGSGSGFGGSGSGREGRDSWLFDEGDRVSQ